MARRIKNEETWQQIREEIIHVLMNNQDIQNENDLMKYFEKYYSDYHIDIVMLQAIIKDSRYINQLLTKNQNNQNEFMERLHIKFEDIIVAEVKRLEAKDEVDDLDKSVLVALHTMFERVINDGNITGRLQTCDETYQDVVNEYRNK